MFHVPSGALSGTPSNGSSDGVDGAQLSVCASRNLSGLLDEQRKRGVGMALLTITGVFFSSLQNYSFQDIYRRYTM